MKIRVLFVCLGNICRSPAAEGVFLHLAKTAGVLDRFEVDSAGTGAWHIGDRADARMRKAADRRGVELPSVARQVKSSDFARFDHIFAMDASNLRALRSMAPASERHKIRLFRDLDPQSPGDDVPDPYYGDAAGFDDVLDIVTRAASAFLAECQQHVTSRKPDSTPST
jgi:protein-tyrosine phosphatase